MKKLRQFGVPAEKEDAERHDAIGHGAEHGADRRTVTSGQEDAADHCGGDAGEDVLGAEGDVAVLKIQVSFMPDRTAASEAQMKRMILTRAVGTPASLAVWTFPPVA